MINPGALADLSLHNGNRYCIVTEETKKPAAQGCEDPRVWGTVKSSLAKAGHLKCPFAAQKESA